MLKKGKLSLYRDETTIFTWFIWMNFSKMFCAILTKSKEFLSSLVFHTVLWTTVFQPILLLFSFVFLFFVVVFFYYFSFLLSKALLVIVWNNLNSNTV